MAYIRSQGCFFIHSCGRPTADDKWLSLTHAPVHPLSPSPSFPPSLPLCGSPAPGPFIRTSVCWLAFGDWSATAEWEVMQSPLRPSSYIPGPWLQQEHTVLGHISWKANSIKCVHTPFLVILPHLTQAVNLNERGCLKWTFKFCTLLKNKILGWKINMQTWEEDQL